MHKFELASPWHIASHHAPYIMFDIGYNFTPIYDIMIVELVAMP